MTAIPITGNGSLTIPVTSGTCNDNIVFSNNNGITLSNSSGVSTTIVADGSGNLRWGATADAAVYKSHTFSKPGLEEKIKEFHAGKYTRKYIETYLDFMVMNAMLDNLEYLEYKVSLDKGLTQ